MEYTNRLEEYYRLKDRGVDASILREHYDGVVLWREQFRKKGRVGSGGSIDDFAQRVSPGYEKFHDMFGSEKRP